MVVPTFTTLLANTTRILVTHATHYMSQCDSIAMVHHNTCTNIGNFSTLKQKTYREKLSKKLNHDQIVEVEREIESLIRTNQEESSKESEDEDKMNHENEKIIISEPKQYQTDGLALLQL